MSALTWQKARRVWALTKYAMVQADWPDAFTPGELGALQYPREGTDAEKRKACQNQGAMVDSIKAAIAADELTTVFRSVQVTIMETVPDYSAVKSSGTHEWLRRDGFTPTKQVKAGERTEEIPVVPCGAFATWLATQGESPGEHIRAWFDAKGAAPAKVGAGGTAKAGGRPKGRQGEQLQKIIDALLVWATKNGESFDSNSMPGQVGKADTAGSFHWLCAKLYPSEFRKGERAFKGYRAGRCVFPAYAKTSDFYSRAIDDIAQSLGVSLNVTAIKAASRKAA
jgi:hypothetical protein